jgi:opacity protein-like surface antigen
LRGFNVLQQIHSGGECGAGMTEKGSRGASDSCRERYITSHTDAPPCVRGLRKDYTMPMLKLAALAGAAMLAFTPAVLAADLLQEPPPAPVVDNSFNWDGAYLGAFIQGQTAPDAFGLGVDLGVNSLMSGLLIGGEVEGVWMTNNQASGQFTGKLGAALSDSAIIYAYTGAGSRTTTSWYVPVGIGAEFKVADNVGLKTEAQYNFDLTNSSENSAALKVGLNFHF